MQPLTVPRGFRLQADVGTQCHDDGRVVVGYANGCEGGCPADVSQAAKSNAAWGTIAVPLIELG